MSKFQLIDEIIKYSNADNWEDAVNEWEFEYAILSKEPYTCICGHYPIKELCNIKNLKNANTLIVGNCCVKKFLNVDVSISSHHINIY